jgi:molecular chaperone HscB
MDTATSNPFATMGVEPQFDLDTDDLHRRFVTASAQVHPDRSTDPEEQLELARQAAQINQAYRVLADPESRAAALLKVLGGQAHVEHKELPAGLLEQMLEVREEMDEAQAAADQAKLDELSTWAEAEQQSYIERIATLFEAWHGGTADPEQALHEIRCQLNALRYIKRMIEQLDPDFDVRSEMM